MSRITRAMVLAAGLGTRMRPLTADTPKPLVRVLGTPMIDHMLDYLRDGGVREAIVNVHYLADQLESHLRQRTSPAVTISDERDGLLETGGGLVHARAALGADPVFCTNTDAIFDPSAENGAASLAGYWDEERMDALLLLADPARATGYNGKGDFILTDKGQVRWPDNVTADAAPAKPQIFTGLQIIHPRLFANEPPGPQSTRLFWDRAMAAGRLFGLSYGGRWMHVGDPAGLAEAEGLLPGLRTFG